MSVRQTREEIIKEMDDYTFALKIINRHPGKMLLCNYQTEFMATLAVYYDSHLFEFVLPEFRDNVIINLLERDTFSKEIIKSAPIEILQKYLDKIITKDMNLLKYINPKDIPEKYYNRILARCLKMSNNKLELFTFIPMNMKILKGAYRKVPYKYWKYRPIQEQLEILEILIENKHSIDNRILNYMIYHKENDFYKQFLKDHIDYLFEYNYRLVDFIDGDIVPSKFTNSFIRYINKCNNKLSFIRAYRYITEKANKTFEDDKEIIENIIFNGINFIGLYEEYKDLLSKYGNLEIINISCSHKIYKYSNVNGVKYAVFPIQKKFKNKEETLVILNHCDIHGDFQFKPTDEDTIKAINYIKEDK